ncbi:MAG: aspartate aminotransferase family protein [Deltaproteobacteria bacterium]|nr:aspartate aminotransferase family protein [Deltaproteobacteria bacterium]
MTDYAFTQKPVTVPKVKSKFRRIVTPIPSPRSIPVLKKLSRYEPQSLHHELPVVWDHASDFQVFDASGNCWIDFTSGIFATNTGHSPPEICRALTRQLNQKLLHNYVFPSQVRAQLAQKIIAMSPLPLNKVFFLSSGSEASECALKLMRLHGHQLRQRKNILVCFDGSFHGRTLGAQMMSGKPAGKKWIRHIDPDIYHLPFPYCQKCPWGRPGYEKCGAWCFKKGIRHLKEKNINLDQVAGFMIESYQGWGAIFYPKDYIQALRLWADQHQCLVTFDEIQSGFARTGRLFAYQHYHVKADLVVCGKGLSGGLPMSAVLGRASILDRAPDLSSTHTGNPVCCAAALANLEIIKKHNLAKKAHDSGKILLSQLNKIKHKYPNVINLILGKGLLYALHIVSPNPDEPKNAARAGTMQKWAQKRGTKTCPVSQTKELDVLLGDRIIEKAMQKGLLMVRTSSGTIKIAPPLTITSEALVEGASVLEEAIKECVS